MIHWDSESIYPLPEVNVPVCNTDRLLYPAIECYTGAVTLAPPKQTEESG
ncbi:hypothetical protein [Candidatus Nitrotoga sp. AM1P]|nr:hypothetical protein [Candidatus Nitrotoga sp. AM1P]